MIQFSVSRDSDSTILSIEVSGHAESGPYGYDLVCAGVSAIVFGGINALIDLGQYEPIVDQARDGGFIRCTLPETLTEEQKSTSQLLLEGMLVSIQTMEASYGEHIKLVEKEV